MCKRDGGGKDQFSKVSYSSRKNQEERSELFGFIIEGDKGEQVFVEAHQKLMEDADTWSRGLYTLRISERTAKRYEMCCKQKSAICNQAGTMSVNL